MTTFDAPLSEVDPEVAAAVADELHRQQSTLEMIASENFAPLGVLEAQGSVLTNKYAEGYPGRRYYGGCEHVDVVEQLAIDRAKALFGAEHANVQPHSGAQANAAAMVAVLQPGDTILGLALAHKPKLIIAGWSAYPRQLDFAEFRRIADLVDAKLMVDMAHFAGLVAAGLHPSP